MGRRAGFFFGVVVAAVVALALGCTPEDREGAVAKARGAIKSACDSLTSEAQKLNSHSPEKALVAAKEKAQDLQKQLSEIKTPTPIESLHLETVREQIQRLDAAINAQAIRRQWETVLKEANRGKELAAGDIEKARRSLRDTNPQFKELDDKLLEAERAYKNAGNRLSEALSREDRASADPSTK